MTRAPSTCMLCNNAPADPGGICRDCLEKAAAIRGVMGACIDQNQKLINQLTAKVNGLEPTWQHVDLLTLLNARIELILEGFK